MEKNYYQILNISHDAEPIIITAAYRVLAKKYHPDHWRGDEEEGNEKIRDINEAYEILSNPQKRKTYDKRNDGKFEHSTNFYENSDISDSEDFKFDDWKIVEDFHPDVEDARKELSLLMPALGVYFQAAILAYKEFEDFHIYAKALEKGFLQNRFGTATRAQKFGKELLIKNHTKLATDFSDHIRVLGNSKTNEIISKFKEENSKVLFGMEADDFEDWRLHFIDYFENYEFITQNDFVLYFDYVESEFLLLVDIKSVSRSSKQLKETNVLHFEINLREDTVSAEYPPLPDVHSSPFSSDEEAFQFIDHCIEHIC